MKWGKSTIFIPVRVDNHWILIVCLMEQKKILYYDSKLTREITKSSIDLNGLIKTLWPNDATTDKFKTPECTQQINNHDCGVHVICNAEILTRQLIRCDIDFDATSSPPPPPTDMEKSYDELSHSHELTTDHVKDHRKRILNLIKTESTSLSEGAIDEP